MSDDTSEEQLDPADAFLIPAHEIRLGILRALWEADNHSLSFSTLRKETGIRDTGNFTYHLSKLEGRYVAHVEDRYELLYPGHRLIDAIQSGVFNQHIEQREIPLSAACPDCAGQLVFSYEACIARIVCTDCAETVLGYPFDPGGFAQRDDSDVPRAFDRRTRRYWLTATDGVCPVCAGPTDVRLVSDATTLQALERYESHYASDQPALVATDCQHCSFYSYVSVGVLLLDHPHIVGTLYDSGVDVRDRYLWELGFIVDADCVELTGTAPRKLVVTARDVDSELRATVDETATIVDVQSK